MLPFNPLPASLPFDQSPSLRSSHSGFPWKQKQNFSGSWGGLNLWTPCHLPALSGFPTAVGMWTLTTLSSRESPRPGAGRRWLAGHTRSSPVSLNKMLPGHGCALSVAADITVPAEPEVLTAWPLTDEVCQLLVSLRVFRFSPRRHVTDS